jgi:guanylate kinase
MKRPLFIVLSGPSGGGKTTLVSRLQETYPVERVLTCTTRSPRPGEQPGKDYHFLSAERFERERREGNFLECSEVYGFGYGLLRSEMEDKIQRSCDLVVVVDVQGVRTLKSVFENGRYLRHRWVSVFVAPDSNEELKKRLLKRGSEGEESFRQRMDSAANERHYVSLFDHLIHSRTPPEDWVMLQDIYRREKEK